MTIYFNESGFISNAAEASASTEVVPSPDLVIPRWADGAWQEGMVRRAHVFDPLGFYLSTALELDPRTNQQYTLVAIPERFILPRFIAGNWIEGVLNFVVLVDDSGYVVSQLKNVDPRTRTANHLVQSPPTDAIVPRYVDGVWTDIGLKEVLVLDAQGYIQGNAKNVDPRVFAEFFTTIFPAANFIVPRFTGAEWIEAGIAHAWQLDADGFFVSDLHNFDPRNIDVPFTTVTLQSGVFRKPQLVDGVWVEADPVLPTELLAIAKSSKQAEIANQLLLELAAGVPFLFGENQDVIQTRFERDLINISGITVRAIILNSQGVSDAVIEFRAESNQTYMITPAQAIALGEAVADHSSQAYAKSWAAKDAIDVAATVEEVEAITW